MNHDAEKKTTMNTLKNGYPLGKAFAAGRLPAKPLPSHVNEAGQAVQLGVGVVDLPVIVAVMVRPSALRADSGRRFIDDINDVEDAHLLAADRFDVRQTNQIHPLFIDDP